MSKGEDMHKGVPRPIAAAVAVTAALSVAVSGCTPAAPPLPPASPVTKTLGYSIPSPPTIPKPTGLTPDQLYNLAVSQYRQFYAMVDQLELQGGATILPSYAKQYLMEPAWGAVEQAYNELHTSGARYLGTPYFAIQRVAPDNEADPPEGTLIAIQTCDLAQGAPMLNPDGSTVQDGSPVIQYRRSYFKFDTDGRLKLFDIHGEGVETCPFD
jgi:hypothetical protein